MSNISTIKLKKSKEQIIQRFHPWVFSGAIAQKKGNPKDGDIVKVLNYKNEIIATGHYNNGSIAVRILAFSDKEINTTFWDETIHAAFQKRIILGFPNSKTNCYRLIHAEGDHLPGLIVDIYDDVAVVQCHSIGMHRCIENIAGSIVRFSEGKIKNVYDKSNHVLPSYYSKDKTNSFIIQNEEKTKNIVLENGHQFLIDWALGQKTGFFLDQRINRQLLGEYAKDKTVLNTFCYSGGFSIYALQQGASLVHSVDISQKAIDWTNENVELNRPFTGKHQAFTQDVLQFLKEEEETYDIVIVDPPAFAKNFKKRHNAVQGYKRLNALAFQRVKEGGIMLTFSCSQVIDALLFQNTIVAAALEAQKKVSIIGRLSQPTDHPVNLFHPEGSYLKGLILLVG